MKKNTTTEIIFMVEISKSFNLEQLEERYKESQKQAITYDAICLTEGNEKDINKKQLINACLRRSQALINFIKVVQETQPYIEKHSKEDLESFGFI